MPFWKLIFSFTISCCFVSTLFCQITPYQTFYQYNWQLINPAAVDKAFMFNEARPWVVNATYRNQWLNIEGSPTVFNLSFEHQPITAEAATQTGVRWGVNLFRDQLDAYNSTGFYGNFAYHFPVSEGKFIHFGTTVGFIGQQLDNNYLQFRETEVGGLFAPDSKYLDINLGIFYRDNQRFYAGVSMPQILTLNATDESVAIQRYYNFIAGGFIPLNKSSRTSTLMLEPYTWLRFVPDLPFSFDANVRLHYNQRFWLGTGYSNLQLLTIEFGLNRFFQRGANGIFKNRIGLGVKSQIPLGGNLNYFGNSIELQVSYAWN